MIGTKYILTGSGRSDHDRLRARLCVPLGGQL